MNKMAITRKTLSLLLSLAMFLMLMPMTAMATGRTTYLEYDTTSGYFTESNADATSVAADMPTLNGGWYVVGSDVEISGRITWLGDVHLILADGKTLTATSSDNRFNAAIGATGEDGNGKDSGRITVHGDAEQSGDFVSLEELIINGYAYKAN